MKLKQYLLASAVGMLPFAASAADLPVKAPYQPVAVAVPFMWTGFYVGATVGGVGFSSKAAFSDPVSGYYYGNLDSSGTSVTGGLTAGYNYQINSIVVGVEADYSFAHVSKNTNSLSTYSYSLIGTSELDGFGTVRARLGYAIDRTLIYVTGGLAFAEVKGSSNFYEPANSGCTASFSQTKTGWTVGGGVEYACTDHISLKLEGLYADVGQTSAVSAHGCLTTFKETYSVGRFGMNYKF